MTEAHLSNATREELLEHIAIQREVIRRLNRRLIDLEAALDYHASTPHLSQLPEPAMAPAGSPPTEFHLSVANASPAVPVEPAHREQPSVSFNADTAAPARGGNRTYARDQEALTKIERVLAAHASRAPTLPSDVVAELLYIREQIKDQQRAQVSIPDRPSAPSTSAAASGAVYATGTPLQFAPAPRHPPRTARASSSIPSPAAANHHPRSSASGGYKTPSRPRGSTGTAGVKWVSPKGIRVVYGRHAESQPSRRGSGDYGDGEAAGLPERRLSDSWVGSSPLPYPPPPSLGQLSPIQHREDGAPDAPSSFLHTRDSASHSRGWRGRI